MHTLRPACILALSFFAAGALAQTSGDSTRGSTPPGMSQDGAAPAEGAIKGGSIRPGEAGGLPNTGGTAPDSAERKERCEQLTGKLREDCLQREQSGAAGATTGTAGAAGTPKEGVDAMSREQPGSK
jgi:hypothetical protein